MSEREKRAKKKKHDLEEIQKARQSGGSRLEQLNVRESPQIRINITKIIFVSWTKTMMSIKL